jgi:alcohol dehydrogenase
MKSLFAPFDYILPTAIRYGEGISSAIADELAGAGIHSVLLITDPGIKQQSFAAEIVENITRRHIIVYIFDQVEANPKDYNVQAAAEQAVTLKVDALVAMGGGSPIDCAKAVSVVAAQGGAVRSYEVSSRIGKNPLPLYTIPTTAGTGSEVTFSSVITDTKEHFKFTIKSPAIAPRTAFIDPLLTLSKPASLTAATGLDALTHAIEAYTAKNANPLSDAAALHAVELINRHLVTAVFEPKNLDARAGMLMGSLLAGIAFSHSDVAGVHCIAEALGGKYDAPHGACNAIALPVMMEYNLEYAVERYARIAGAMNLTFAGDEDGARLAAERVRSLAEEVNLPDFRSLGVQETDLRELAENSARNGSSRDNPRPMSADDYMRILEKLYRG